MRRTVTGEQYAASKTIELHVRQETTLMEFLMKEMYGISRNKVKDILQGHGVQVNKKLVTQYDYPLLPGQVVHVSRHKRSTELNSKFVRIVYEDKDIIVINKSEGILSMESAPGQYCVKTILNEYFKKRHFKCTAHVVHRLDRETSGLMIYAKSLESRKILEENWHDLVYDRRYVAVLCGEMEQEGGTVRSWLRDNKAFVTYSSPTDNGGKLAITYYHRLRVKNGLTLAEMKLETGRKNQIRVHMKDLGYPVAGDTKYGNGRNPLGRLALHAYRLNFFHPITGERMVFETPFPTPFLKFFDEKEEKQKS